MKKTLYGIGVFVILIVGIWAYFYQTFGTVRLPQDSDEGVVATSSGSLPQFAVPEGFSMSVYASDLDGPRVMVFDKAGSMLVSEPGTGKVIALSDTDNDNVADRQDVVIDALNAPHGMAFDCRTEPCVLYIAELDAVRVYEYDPILKKAKVQNKVADLPGGGGHSTRTLLFMPSPDDNILLISVGSSCNVCKESDERRAAILAYDTETGQTTEYAHGLRNSVFMEIHPVTGAIWATDNGRDGLGDDVPPDELNIVEKGKDYGWPYCYGQNIHDRDFDSKNVRSCDSAVPAAIDFQAHSAALGLAFIPEEGWPEEWWYDAIVAFHGSWNRSYPTGYKLVRVPLDAQGKQTGPIEDFITGFMRPDGRLIGRPVDVVAHSGGVIYISDDRSGYIYRVVRQY